MVKRPFLAVLCAVCGMAVFGQELTVAVSPFEVRSGFTNSETETIYNLFTTGLTSSQHITLVSRTNFDRIAAELNFQTLDWTDSGKVRQLGRALAVDCIIRGQLMRLGNQLVITMNILDTGTGQGLASSRGQFRDIDDIFGRMVSLVNDVVTKLPNPYAAFDIRNNVLFKYKGPGGSVTIPSGVTAIGERAFAYINDIVSVNIPWSVTSIGRSAFAGCTGLTSILIPAGVKAIEEYAFADCTGLTSLRIPASVTFLGSGAFSGCSGLTSISLPSSITSIEDGLFSGCSKLTSVKIPLSVTSIGNAAFFNCVGLLSIDIPSSVTVIKEGAFSGCSRLASVNIPSSIKSIENQVFYGCASLASVNIPSSVTYIGARAFARCFNLTTIELSRRTRLGNGAFMDVPGSLQYRRD